MRKINITVSEYKIEEFSFKFAPPGGKNEVNFIVGLYTDKGNKITSIMFSNLDVGLPFKPGQNINNSIRELIMMLDQWVWDNYLLEENHE